jgi:hypothetical protein
VRRSHEYWFHFTREPHYFSAIDEIREAHAGEILSTGVRNPRYGRDGGQMPGRRAGLPDLRQENAGGDGNHFTAPLNPLGKLPGSVWTIPTQPLTVPDSLGIDHFAAFPMEWPRRIIRGWSPSGICTVCGEGRRPVVEKAAWWDEYKREHKIGDYMAGQERDGTVGKQRSTTKVPIPEGPKTVITGESCACPEPTAPTRPAVILDPFGGTGTVATVAKVFGRQAIHVDLSIDYCRIAEWRVNDPAQLARAERK